MERTRIVFYIILGVTALAIIAAILIGPRRPDPLQPPTETPTSARSVGTSVTTPTSPPSEDDIVIELWTNDTKATWVRLATEMFNARNETIESSRRIIAQVEQMDSGDFGPRLLETEKSGAGPTIISPGTIAWVNEAGVLWQDLHPGQSLVTSDCPPLAYGPIGFGLWQRMAEAMGWPDTPIGWQEIVELAADPEGWARYGHPEWGQFKFGHTDPSSSNTGLTAMTSFVYATLGQTEGLTPALVRSPEVIEAVETLELNTFHYGSSTRSLNVSTATRGKAYLHAVASSENSILATNFFQRELMDEPLVFIFPKEGAFWSENPFCVVNAPWVSPEQREAAEVYRRYLMSEEAQKRTVEGWLRPVDLAHMPETLPEEWQYTDRSVTIADIPPLETDTSGDTTAAVQDIFFQAKKRATIIIVLDRSQSMAEGQKLPAAIEGTIGFLQAEALHKEDEVQLFIFNDTVTSLQPLSPAGAVGETLSQQLSGIWPEGNTALYDAVCQAKDAAEAARTEDVFAEEERLYGIILLSDGEDTNSQRTQDEMLTNCVPRRESADVVKLYTVAYGEDADQSLLERIANRTNGKTYTADASTIHEVLQEIVWEQ
jgi:Ca-activated chloride channel family protein